MIAATVGPRFMGIVAIAVVVLAAIPITIEFRGLSGSGAIPRIQAQTVSRGQMLPGWSTIAHKRFANRCYVLLTGRLLHPGEAPLDPALNAEVRTGCAAGLESIVRHSPGDAVAWASLALVRAQTADVPGLLEALARSRATAPDELWVASRRVELAEPMLPFLSAADAQGHRQDMLVLAQSLRGVRQIASRYVTDLEFRDRIITLVETLPAEEQMRFLQNVRRAARDAGLL